MAFWQSQCWDAELIDTIFFNWQNYKMTICHNAKMSKGLTTYKMVYWNVKMLCLNVRVIMMEYWEDIWKVSKCPSSELVFCHFSMIFKMTRWNFYHQVYLRYILLSVKVMFDCFLNTLLQISRPSSTELLQHTIFTENDFSTRWFISHTQCIKIFRLLHMLKENNDIIFSSRFLQELKGLLQDEFGANPLLKKKKQALVANRSIIIQTCFVPNVIAIII